MLGWMFIVETLYVSVTRPSTHNLEHQKSKELARWESSMYGLRWLLDLTQQGKAEQISFDGYPNCYMLRAAVLKEALKDGIPKHDGPTVFGDDYVMLGDHISKIEIHKDRIAKVKDTEWLTICAWDLS